MICVRFSLMCVMVMMKCQSFLASTSISSLHIQQTDSTTFVHILCTFSHSFCIIQLCFRMNRSRESASQSLSINQSIILELFNSCTPLNALFSCIPSSVSDGMSISDTIINHHSPISLSLYNRNAIHLL